jgi:hypothetical protein
MKNIKSLGLNLIITTSLALSLTGCSKDEDTKSSPSIPTIQVSSLEVSRNGAEITWHVSINNDNPSTKIRISPWNDTTYFWTDVLPNEYNYDIELDCNTEIGSNGTIKCNDITSITCTRVMMGSDYSEYTCDYGIGSSNAIVPQYQTKMRVPTQSNGTPSQNTLLTIGTKYFYEESGTGYEKSAWINFEDETKMYNVYTNGIGKL